MTQTRWITLAVLLLGALLLAGCGGGGGGDGVKQDLEAQLEALMAERNAARQAQQTAEAAQTAAEEAQAVAETARQAAETARAAAEAERDTAQAAELAAKAVEAQAVADLAEAQAAEMTAKAAQKAAEAARATAEGARATADAARKAAEAARATAETERDAAKAAQAEAVAAQAEAVAAQAEAEAAQAESVAAELAAKAAQTAAEASRDAAVKAKTAAEAARDEKRNAATEAQIALIAAEVERDAAQAKVTRLTGELETANDNVTELTGERDTANGEVTRLTGLLNTATAGKTTAEAEVTRLTGLLNTANDKVEELEARVGSATDATSLTGMLDAANAAVTRLTGLLKTANDKVTELEGRIGSASDATSLQGMLEAEKLKLSRLQNQVSIHEDTIEGLRDQLADARAGVTDAEQRADQAERDADRKVEEAQRQGDVDARVAQYLQAINGGGAKRTAVTVSYERGSTLMIDPGGNFVSGSGAPSISGFTARTYTREVGVTGEQTVYLYTNIRAPGSRAFWKEHGLTVPGANSNAGQNPTPSSGTPSFITDPMESAQADGLRISGTYDGVSGTYTCTTGGCMGAKEDISREGFVQIVAGERSFAQGGTWDFKPSSINSGIRQDEDTEHLYFGIWVNEPNLASSAHAYQYIDGGSDGMLTYPNLTGTAQFRGGAVGKYVTRNQVGENARIGTFTAAVNLTANFDADTLEGRVTDFRDGSQQLTGWNVYLGGTTTGPVTSFDGSSFTDGVATASIGGVAATGAWGATLRGTNNELLGYDVGNPPGSRDLTKYPLARYPLADLAGIVGNFHATSNETAEEANAAIAGAFAATP